METYLALGLQGPFQGDHAHVHARGSVRDHGRVLHDLHDHARVGNWDRAGVVAL